MSVKLKSSVNEETMVMFQSTSMPPGGQEKDGPKTKQYLAAIVATLGAFSAGSVMGWTSPSLPPLQSPGSHLLITPEEGSWVGCLLAVGALAGALPAGVFADKVGRKIAMQTIAAPLVISWVIILFANSVGMLYAARLVAGLGVGAICVVAPIYVGEIASSSIRGTLGGFFQLQITLGILFAYAVGAAVDYTWLALLSGLVPLVFFGALFLVPETPYFLLSKRKRNDAEVAMKWLSGYLSDHARQTELTSMQMAIAKAKANEMGFAASVKSLFTDRASRNAFIIGLGLMLFQQLSGINAVIFYSVAIFEEAGSSMAPSVSSIVVGVVQVLACYAALILVDRAGRRLLLLISALVMALCLGVLGTYFYLMTTDIDISSLGFIPLASLVLFIVTFSLGFGPIPWTMLGELFPPQIKGAASALACVENYLLCFVVTKTFQNLLNVLGSAGTFWMFASICVVGAVFVFFRVPETKGKTLDEIQEKLAK